MQSDGESRFEPVYVTVCKGGRACKYYSLGRARTRGQAPRIRAKNKKADLPDGKSAFGKREQSGFRRVQLTLDSLGRQILVGGYTGAGEPIVRNVQVAEQRQEEGHVDADAVGQGSLQYRD